MRRGSSQCSTAFATPASQVTVIATPAGRSSAMCDASATRSPPRDVPRSTGPPSVHEIAKVSQCRAPLSLRTSPDTIASIARVPE